MRIAGLTGGIGAGKSTVAKMLVERGARLIDADLLARQVVEPGKPAWQDIVAEFGQEVLQPDQTINRDMLAAIVFNDPPKRRLLNSLTHPRIGEEARMLFAKYAAENAGLVIFDAALLLESPSTNWIRPVIVVTASDEVKISRVCARDRACRKDVEARIRSQWPDEKRAAMADYVIDNSRDLAHLERQVDQVYKSLTGPEKSL